MRDHRPRPCSSCQDTRPAHHWPHEVEHGGSSSSFDCEGGRPCCSKDRHTCQCGLNALTKPCRNKSQPNPLSLQLAHGPSCGGNKCYISYPVYIAARANAFATCPHAHDLECPDRCGCLGEHRGRRPRHNCEGGLRERDRAAKEPWPPCKAYQGDRSASGHIQSRAYAAIATVSGRRHPGDNACCANGGRGCAQCTASIPDIPVDGGCAARGKRHDRDKPCAVSCKCRGRDQPCARRFLNQDRARQYILGKYGPGAYGRPCCCSGGGW
jgi:hypothetical protein